MAASSHDRLIYLSSMDQFFYFDTIPEDTNRYNEASHRVQELKKLLLDSSREDRLFIQVRIVKQYLDQWNGYAHRG